VAEVSVSSCDERNNQKLIKSSNISALLIMLERDILS